MRNLPSEIQIQIWKHVFRDPDIADLFHWTTLENSDPPSEYALFRDPAPASSAIHGTPVCLTTRSGRTIYVVDLNLGYGLYELKWFWNYISVSRLSRQIGLEGWRSRVEKGETCFERGPEKGWENDFEDLEETGLHVPSLATPEMLAELKERVLEVLGEIIEEVKTGG